MLFPPTLSHSGLLSAFSDLCELAVCHNRWNISWLKLRTGEIFSQRRFAFSFDSNEEVQPIWGHVSGLAPPPVHSLLSSEGFKVHSPRLPFLTSSLTQSSVSWQHYCNQYSPSGRSGLTSHSLFFFLTLISLLLWDSSKYPTKLRCPVAGAPWSTWSDVARRGRGRPCPLTPALVISDAAYTGHGLPIDTQALAPSQGRKNVSSSGLPSGEAWHWDILSHRNEYLLWLGWVWMLWHLWGIALWIPHFVSGHKIGLLLWTLLPFLKSVTLHNSSSLWD